MALMLGLMGTVCCVAQVATEPKSQHETMTGRDDAGSDRRPFLSTVYPEDGRPIVTGIRLARWAEIHRVRSFGWIDGGFTHVSNASGLVAEAPTPNRFSDQAVLNAGWVAIERHTTKTLSWGFRSDFYAGSDAALLRSENYFGPGTPRWGTELRQAYFVMHTPSISSGGIDWTLGRINFPTGAETVLAPYQQLYSRSYLWIHGETSGTALLATIHTNSQFDVVMGATMGYNTTFLLRGRTPSYIARALYHPTIDRKQQVIVTAYTGPEPLATAQGHVGSWQTLAELQIREAWTRRFSQIFDSSYIADASDPANKKHNSAAQSASALSAFILRRDATLHARVEWFADQHGSRIKIPGSYGEATLGAGLHPNEWLEFRPEIR
jgi:hypothetical protein